MACRKQTITMLTTSEVAWLLHVHSNTVRRWADRGRLRIYRACGRCERRLRRADVARLLAKLGA